MRILIKIGSRVIAQEGQRSGIDRKVLLNIASQVSELISSGHQIILVTSGAVASCPLGHLPKNLQAAIGQPKLILEYSTAFSIFETVICQLLYTHEDLSGRRSQYTSKLIREALKNNIVPIVNANDGVNSKELDALKEFADNDVLATKLAKMVDADLVVILINEEGLIDFESGKVIYAPKNIKAALKLVRKKSDVGTGGMKSKLEMAAVLMKSGIQVRFLPGKAKDSVLKSIAGEKIGTVFE